MPRYTYGQRSMRIELRDDLRKYLLKDLLKIAQDSLDNVQWIDLFYTDQPGVVELYHPRLTFGMCQRVCKALDKEPILIGNW